jgi:hypothetical protein
MNNRELSQLYIKLKRKELCFIILCFTVLLFFYYILLLNSFVPKKPFIHDA